MQISEQTKKGFLYFGFCLVVFALIFLSAYVIHSTTRVNNNNSTKYGTFRIRLSGQGWDLGERTKIVNQSLTELSRLGPAFQSVEAGEHVEVFIDDTVQSRSSNCYAGLYIPGPSPRIKLIPTCIRSNLEFQSTFMHEVGHAVGMQHICRRTGEASDCSNVGHQVSFMNPGLNYGTVFQSLNISNETDSDISVPMLEVTTLDIKEFQRVWNGLQY